MPPSEDVRAAREAENSERKRLGLSRTQAQAAGICFGTARGTKTGSMKKQQRNAARSAARCPAGSTTTYRNAARGEQAAIRFAAAVKIEYGRLCEQRRQAEGACERMSAVQGQMKGMHTELINTKQLLKLSEADLVRVSANSARERAALPRERARQAGAAAYKSWEKDRRPSRNCVELPSAGEWRGANALHDCLEFGSD